MTIISDHLGAELCRQSQENNARRAAEAQRLLDTMEVLSEEDHRYGTCSICSPSGPFFEVNQHAAPNDDDDEPEEGAAVAQPERASESTGGVMTRVISLPCHHVFHSHCILPKLGECVAHTTTLRISNLTHHGQNIINCARNAVSISVRERRLSAEEGGWHLSTVQSEWSGTPTVRFPASGDIRKCRV